MSDDCLLVGDIGGTNARFALADSAAPGFDRAETLACADYTTGDEAIRAYLDSVGAGQPDVICLAAAGPIVNDSVRFTNNHWSLSVANLQADFETDKVRLLNDFEANSYSIPSLTADDCLPVGLPDAHDLGDGDFNIGIIGPGTGLGTGGLCRRGDFLFPIVGEGGHVGFAPETQLQLEVLVAVDLTDTVGELPLLVEHNTHRARLPKDRPHRVGGKLVTAHQDFQLGELIGLDLITQVQLGQLNHAVKQRLRRLAHRPPPSLDSRWLTQSRRAEWARVMVL